MAISASCLFLLANIVTLEGEVGGIDSDFLTALRLEESDISTAVYERVSNEASNSVTLLNAQAFEISETKTEPRKSCILRILC